MTDDGGYTPLDMAINKDHTEVVEYLKSRSLSSTQPGKQFALIKMSGPIPTIGPVCI